MSQDTRFTSRRRGPVPCVACSRKTDEPRRGLCYACYLRERRGASVDTCAVCGLADRRMLTKRTTVDGPRVLCGNHALVLGRRALSVAELAAEVFPEGDRRRGDRRASDRRGFSERRRVTDVERLLEGDRREPSGRRASDAA